MNRRDFLITTAAASFAAPRWTSAAESQTKLQTKSPILDTHVHCFAGAQSEKFPYHARAPYRPPEPATPEQLLKCMDGAGVASAIIVHPEPYQDDHRYLEYCLDVGKGRLKGTCLFFADRPGSVAGLPALVKRVPLVAMRVHAYAPDRLPPFGKPELRALWKLAGDHDLAVQLHFEPRRAPGFEPYIKEFSATKVIIDHLGRPFQGTPEEHEVVVKWSRFNNTILKLSAIPANTTYPHRDINPVIKRLVSEFSPDRVIYGGGFADGATGESYRAAIEQIRSRIANLPAEDQAKIMGGNAVKLFGFRA